MKIFNAKMFGGFFPHKGKTCARIDNPASPLKWMPVKKGETVALASPRSHSAGHLPVTSVAEKVSNNWIGLARGDEFVTLGSQRVTLTKKWEYEVCDGPSHWWESLPIGSVILPVFNSGNARVASTFWVLDKEITV